MLFNIIKKIKTVLPQTLLGRSLIILIAPVLLIQSVMTYVFIDRHLTKTTELLAENISGGISASLSLFSDREEEKGNTSVLIPFVREHFYLELFVQPPSTQKSLLPEYGWLENYLARYLKKKISLPFQVVVSDPYSHIMIYTLEKDLTFTFETKRLFSKTTEILLWWALGTPLLFLFIAILFLRNQVRPLRRLAEVVEAFGTEGLSIQKGLNKEIKNSKEDVDLVLHPSGAYEIRKVTEAFNAMRERIHRQMEQRTRMLAGVSHDLGTSLARMSLQLAVMPESDDLQDLREDLRDMEQMLASYLAFARGEVEEVVQGYSLHKLLMSAMRGVDAKNITVDWPQEDLILKGRKNALRRCLMNLIQNGLRYASHVWVSVICLKYELHIIIEDNGKGVPEDQREKVFTPFIRLEESRNNETGGAGLGLSIARDIARSHGGEILLESSSQGGLKVRLILPL